MDIINNLLIENGINATSAKYLSIVIVIVIIAFLCVIADIITKKIILGVLNTYIMKNNIKWDDHLLNRKVFHKLAAIVPAIIIYVSAPVFKSYQDLIQKIALTYIFIIITTVIKALLNAIDDIYRSFPISKSRPIKGLLQVIEFSAYIIMGIIIIANLIDKSPLLLLSGIGAIAAVFSFVFKDSILGLVAGIQLSANDMLRIGDWIGMPKYGADGIVTDITINTVKVQNFDKTIVTIPAYTLISDSFKNWRGMQEAGGRRIKRSIYIDMTSIRFCTEEMLNKYKKIDYIKDYINKKENEIYQYNKDNKINDELLINGRHLTNIGTFRAYIQNYLENHPKVHKEMSLMVRQLAPEYHGLPLEIYAFINDTKWVNFENAQADIFDHILAVAEEFELRIFQNPTGYDIKPALQHLKSE